MRIALTVLLGLYLLVSAFGVAAEQKFLLELNSAEALESRCRLNFVVQNKSEATLDSMKFDLVVFDAGGAIKRRLLAEMGPVRPLKTVVRTFLIDVECAQISSILVNDVVACTPATAGDCLDELSLSSRVKELRLYK